MAPARSKASPVSSAAFFASSKTFENRVSPSTRRTYWAILTFPSGNWLLHASAAAAFAYSFAAPLPRRPTLFKPVGQRVIGPVCQTTDCLNPADLFARVRHSMATSIREPLGGIGENEPHPVDGSAITGARLGSGSRPSAEHRLMRASEDAKQFSSQDVRLRTSRPLRLCLSSPRRKCCDQPESSWQTVQQEIHRKAPVNILVPRYLGWVETSSLGQSQIELSGQQVDDGL